MQSTVSTKVPIAMLFLTIIKLNLFVHQGSMQGNIGEYGTTIVSFM
jgi:hypothetical protein